jgi:feruloyl esterase
VGNGGMAGAIPYPTLAEAVAAGYATVGSDLGHEGGFIDGSFAIGRPDRVVDWGHRATHEMTVRAKAIAAAFYGRPAARAYFTGCSGGGRQGLMEAQRHPEDYDGILAGDPTADFTHLTTGGRLWVELAMLREEGGRGYIPPAKLPALAAAVVAACDGLDGVADGVLEDPRQCRFDPAVLQCRGAETDACLTGPQVTALRRIYAGATTRDGTRIFPGYEPGGELGPGGWAANITGPAPFQAGQWAYASGFLKGLVFEDPGYDPLRFDFERDVAPMDAKPVAGSTLAATINATDPDLSGFRARGGRMIQYHGWSDPGVAPQSSTGYYDSVLARQPDAAAFYRLFMVPGMQHCTGGPGPSRFDGLAALVRWVEQGEAPERITASLVADGRVLRTRPLCPYPRTARFTGGNPDDAGSFECR